MIYATEEGNDLNYGFGYFNDIDENQKITVEFDYDDHDDSEEKTWADYKESSKDKGGEKVLSVNYTYPMGNSYGENKISQIETGFEYFKSDDRIDYIYITDATTTAYLSDYTKKRTSAYLNFGYYLTCNLSLSLI